MEGGWGALELTAKGVSSLIKLQGLLRPCWSGQGGGVSAVLQSTLFSAWVSSMLFPDKANLTMIMWDNFPFPHLLVLSVTNKTVR